MLISDRKLKQSWLYISKSGNSLRRHISQIILIDLSWGMWSADMRDPTHLHLLVLLTLKGCEQKKT